jgi:hypothetical protein
MSYWSDELWRRVQAHRYSVFLPLGRFVHTEDSNVEVCCVRKLLSALVIASLLTGCYRITYRVGDAPDKTYTVRTWHNFFVLGLAPVDDTKSLETLCPGSKILEVKTFASPANVLSVIASLGLSTGTSMEYTCTFPEDRLSKSAGRLRDTLLSKLGLDGDGASSSSHEDDE